MFIPPNKNNHNFEGFIAMTLHASYNVYNCSGFWMINKVLLDQSLEMEQIS